MTSGQIEIQAIAIVTAVACALLGTFLVLRRTALVADAISHSILVGIAVGFLATGSVTSPLLILFATAAGVLTVVLVETLTRTRRVREDAAIGLVFPALFAIGVILISRYADGVHLDLDAVLLGELAFAPFDRVVAFGWDFGPVSLVAMSSILVAIVVLLTLFWKELKVATFDPGLALAVGLAPALVHYGLMTMVSVTAVGAFNAVGSILVVALVVAPPAAAYLLTDRLGVMLGLAAAIGAACALGGYWLSYALDASIAGCMACACGVAFVLAWLGSPRRGLLAMWRTHARQRVEFAGTMLAIHLLQHEGQPDADRERELRHLQEHLRWEPDFSERVVRRARDHDLVAVADGHLVLTDRGRSTAYEALNR